MGKNYDKEKAKIYRDLHKEEAKAYRKVYAKVNKDKIKAYNQKYHEDNKSEIQARKKIWAEVNKEFLKKYRKEYQKTHKDKLNKQANVNLKQRRTDPQFRLNGNMASAIYTSLKGNKKGRHWETLVSYTLEQLKKHLEKQFKRGMTWKNYGRNGWQIDHKVPKSVFNFAKPEHNDFKKCWALKNLQPMWEYDNIIKGNHLTKHFQPSLLI